jgi:hypothetical protein
VPVTERTLAVVAETLDGRRVDPVRAAASNSDVAYVELGTVARGYDVFWVSYMQRIEGRASHHRALRDWIMAHHERTGNQMDRVVHFDAVTIELTSPLPGELEPGKIETRKFLQGP